MHGLTSLRSRRADKAPLGAVLTSEGVSRSVLIGYTIAYQVVTETRYIEGQGRYALAEMVGRGGFATVWRARSLKGSLRGKDVAVKIIPVYSAGERSRALREGQIAEGLRHKNIVETLEVIPGDHEIYLVTEYVRGMPLDEAAKGYGVDEIVDSLAQILEALVYAHGQGTGNIRLNFSFPPPERIREGVRRLARVVEQEIAMREVFGAVDVTDPHLRRPRPGADVPGDLA